MRTNPLGALLLLCPIWLACSGSGDQPLLGSGGTATATGQGGAAPSVGGTASQGGASAPGGSGVGGSVASGGQPPNGGTSTSGGATTATGGSASNLGGAPTGGRAATGGAAAPGGTSTGGGKATGGSATGGGLATGGTGGTTTGGAGTGGKSTGGTSTGGVATGGASGTGQTPGACATNQIEKCIGTNPITCDFGGNPGDYEVTVELGGAAAGNMYVDAETYRRLLPPTTTAAGETKRFAFGVNVRQPEGQPVQAVSAGTPGLQIYIRGTAPQLTAICAKALAPAPKVWIAGDSTVCDQDGIDYGGWGQHLPRFFGLPVAVANYADSGESSSTVLNSAKMWGAIKAAWKAGDWALVQVGHNDKDVTAATFQANISAYVTQAKAAGVNIILCTPTARVGYTLAAEHISSTGANLPQIIRDVGTSQNVPVIDLTVLTWNWLQTVTWSQYFALGTDRTHTNHEGADVIAGQVSAAIRSKNLGLATHLR